MATTPARLSTLQEAVASLRPQVQALRVYLNGFTVRPEFLAPQEVVFSHEASGNLGAEGKFYWFDKEHYTYYLSVDDDLRYPPDYTARLIEAFERRRRRALIGVHGFVFAEPLVSYTESRQARYKCTRALAADTSVHVLGTATTLLHPAVLPLTMANFPRRNMADLQLAIAAQRHRIPLIAVQREADWIQELLSPSAVPSIWSATKADGGQQKAAVARQAVQQWQLWPDPLTESVRSG